MPPNIYKLAAVTGCENPITQSANCTCIQALEWWSNWNEMMIVGDVKETFPLLMTSWISVGSHSELATKLSLCRWHPEFLLVATVNLWQTCTCFMSDSVVLTKNARCFIMQLCMFVDFFVCLFLFWGRKGRRGFRLVCYIKMFIWCTPPVWKLTKMLIFLPPSVIMTNTARLPASTLSASK